MIKCILVTYSLWTGGTMEHVGHFRDCESAAEYVQMMMLREEEPHRLVLGINPAPDWEQDDDESRTDRPDIRPAYR